jgi:2-polyprenyl-3-methyl-5-hydroxy-6-metoxy-1,4-benzoquinol methylase
MDQPGLAEEAHSQALRGLARINFWTGSARILWPPLRALAREVSPAPLRVLDLATGGGDIPVRLWRRARRAGIRLAIDGCDLSPTAITFARERAARKGAAVRFFEGDVLHDDLPPGYDAVVSSLFLHHLDEEQAVDLLQRMAAAAGRLVLVNDLGRSATGYALAYLGTRLLSASAVVRTDGLWSVAGAFTPAEARLLAQRADLQGATVAKRWPFRFLLTWRRP